VKVNELFEGEVVPIRKDVIIPPGRARRPSVKKTDDQLNFYTHLYFTDIPKSFYISQFEVKRIEKSNGRPFQRVNASYIWGKGRLEDFPRNKRNGVVKFPPFVKHPPVQYKTQPHPKRDDREYVEPETFVLKFDGGEKFLVWTEDHASYMRGWLQIK